VFHLHLINQVKVQVMTGHRGKFGVERWQVRSLSHNAASITKPFCIIHLINQVNVQVIDQVNNQDDGCRQLTAYLSPVLPVL
jgi:hypothetical protein